MNFSMLLIFSFVSLMSVGLSSNLQEGNVHAVQKELIYYDPQMSQEKVNRGLLSNIDRCSFSCSSNYWLFTRSNMDTPQQLLVHDNDSILNSYFNPDLPTVVIVHGWMGNSDNEINPTIKNAVLNNNDINVIVVDWRRLSHSNYMTAVIGVPIVGRHLGQFLSKVNSLTGASYDSMHLAGHSLGSHVVGNAGKYLKGKIARITGLDPAGPGWLSNIFRLKQRDAKYVEVIHTNAGFLGTVLNLGHANFFPNGGTWQPGCLEIVCCHERSWRLFADSLNRPYIGRKCPDSSTVNPDLCNGPPLEMGDLRLEYKGTGIYYVQTE